ncbi:hypothetical protein ACFL1X_03535 [Candidatus Hydrogenedentota bacterium]
MKTVRNSDASLFSMTLALFIPLSFLATSCITGDPAMKTDAHLITLENKGIRAEFEVGPGGLQERYFTKDGRKSRLVATNVVNEGLGATFFAADDDDGDRTHATPDLNDPKNTTRKGKRGQKRRRQPTMPEGPPAETVGINYTSLSRDDAGNSVTFKGETAHGDKVERKIRLMPDENLVRVEVTFETSRKLLVEYLNDLYNFAPEGKPDFTWTQELKKSENDVFPDWTFKSPAAFIQKDDIMLALIPDLDTLKHNKSLLGGSATLDLDVTTGPGPTLSYGLVPSIPYAHSHFMHMRGQRQVVEPGKISYAYYILLDNNVPEGQAHREVVSFLWDKFGNDALLKGHAAQNQTFDEWAVDTWEEYILKRWIDVDYNNISCGGIKRHMSKVEPVSSIWFSGWWNNLRTAYAMELYSRRLGNKIVGERAGKILNLALEAPRKEGAFPIVFVPLADEAEWTRDHRFGGYEECYHIFDMSWTSYWLLRWRNELGAKDERILPYCQAYGDFLLKNQKPSGFIPSYYNEDLSVRAETRLNEESAEPAACAVFLIELYKTTDEKKYLDAATKAMEYLQREIVPEAKWFDYETFLSCSKKAYDFYDPITNQHPQNNQGTIQAAKAFLALHEATDEDKYLDWGMNVLDYLSLTQQVWSHPAMTPNLIGGFTTQNTDAEWSDARQAYCAVIYLDYFEKCGKLEYLERGIAALRSGFPVAPYENWSHIGYPDRQGALSGFNWGQGSAMASVEMVRERYGDILADLKGKWAYGINGCTVEALESKDGVIDLSIKTDLEWSQPARIVFRNVSEGKYDVIVNGRSHGKFGAEALLKGVEVRI